MFQLLIEGTKAVSFQKIKLGNTMIKIGFTGLAAFILSGIGTAAAPAYTEDFTGPAKLSNSGATAELGNGGSYSVGTWSG